MQITFKNIKYERYYKDFLPYLKKEKNQKYFAIVLTLGASIFFALFAINPTLSTIAKLRKEVLDSRFVEQNLSKKISSLSSLSGAYLAIENDIPFVLDAIPTNPDAPVLAAQIQSIAENSGVSLIGFEVASINLTSPAAVKSSSFGFELTAQSNYDSLQEFTSNLINMQRIVSIDSISITKTKGDDQNLQIHLKGFAYFKK